MLEISRNQLRYEPFTVTNHALLFKMIQVPNPIFRPPRHSPSHAAEPFVAASMRVSPSMMRFMVLRFQSHPMVDLH